MLYKRGAGSVFPECYLIKVNSFNDVAKTSLDEWIYFLKNEEIKDNFHARGLKRAKEELDILKLSDEEYRAYERYEENLHYQASMVQSTYVLGMEKGMEQGLALAKGIEQGIERGRR